ncbi:MAG: hypothetical protein WED09_09720 [Homoserinimonas sp.]
MTGGMKLHSSLAAAVFVFAVAITGCAPQQTDYDPDFADILQGEVLEVSELSAGADFEAALLALTELEAALKDARARDLLTEERYEAILAATALVRADLEAAIAAQAPPPPAPEPEGDSNGGNSGEGEGGDDGDADKGNGEGKGKGNDDKKDEDD